MKKLNLFLVSLCVVSAASAKTLYVKPDVSSVAWSNASAGSVYTDLKTAMENAVFGDEIWVSAGEYQLSEALNMKDGVSIYGGFVGTETSVEDRVKVEGGNPWDFVNETVITKDPLLAASNLFNQTATFNNPRITDGFTFEKSIGTACTVRKGTTVQNCIFRENVSTWGGGGVQMYQGGTVRYCYFYNNISRSDDRNGGAGLYSNASTLDTPMFVENCVFDSNYGRPYHYSIQGGGLKANAATTVANCIFYNNMAGDATLGYGQGAAIFSAYPSNTFINCLVYNNSGSPVAVSNGGTFVNLTVCNNLVGIKGSSDAVYFGGAQTQILGNSVIWNNQYTNKEISGIYTAVNNYVAILYNLAHNGEIISAETSTWDDHVYVLSNDNMGSAENENYPEFINPTTFIGASVTLDADSLAEIRSADWRIKSTSFLVDKGDNLSVDIAYDKDLAGNIRALTEGDPCDLGAYEAVKGDSHLSLSAIDESCIYASSGYLYVNSEYSRVSVFNISGKLVVSFNTGNLVEPVALESGIYIVKVETDGHSVTGKVVL